MCRGFSIFLGLKTNSHNYVDSVLNEKSSRCGRRSIIGRIAKPSSIIDWETASVNREFYL